MSEITCVHISGINSSANNEVISGLLSMFDHQGLEEGEGYLKVYFETNASPNQELTDLLEEIRQNYFVEISTEILPDVNWNATWESNFEPVLVNDWVGVRASFHQPFAGILHDIVIDPKMSFGTGHHATTWQMLSLMRHIPFSKKKVLDLGCGTAVLSILAAMMGAEQVTAIDNDRWCAENSRENCQLNEVSGVNIIEGELLQAAKDFDIILANINRNYLLDNMTQIQDKLVKGGYLFISGFYGHEANMLLDKALEHNLIANYYSERDHWCAIILHK